MRPQPPRAVSPSASSLSSRRRLLQGREPPRPAVPRRSIPLFHSAKRLARYNRPSAFPRHRRQTPHSPQIRKARVRGGYLGRASRSATRRKSIHAVVNDCFLRMSVVGGPVRSPAASEDGRVPGMPALLPVNSTVSARDVRLAVSLGFDAGRGSEIGTREETVPGGSLFLPAATPEWWKRVKRLEMKGDNLVVRRIVTLMVSFCLVLGLGIMQVYPTFRTGAVQEGAAPAKPDAAPKEAAKPDTPEARRAGQDAGEVRRAGQEGRGPAGHRAPLASDPQGSAGQDRRRPPRRGRGDRRRAGCRPGGDLDRSRRRSSTS